MKFVIAAILFICLATAEAAVEMSPQLKEAREAVYTGIHTFVTNLQYNLGLNVLTQFVSPVKVKESMYKIFDTVVMAGINFVEPFIRDLTDLIQRGAKMYLGGPLGCMDSLLDEFYTTLDYVKTALEPKT